MSPEKPNAGTKVQLSEGFITKQIQNTIWVPEMAHPTENALGSSTSQSETDINPNLLHENLPASASRVRVSLSGPAFAPRQPIWPSISLSGLCVSL